jgi:hypothetical protein
MVPAGQGVMTGAGQAALWPSQAVAEISVVSSLHEAGDEQEG